MPKLYEYFGIIIFFYSNEHEPIHVHGRYQGKESKAEIIIQEGEILEIRIEEVMGKRPLDSVQLNDFRKFVQYYADNIVQKWIDYFVFHRKVMTEKIAGRLK
ncbi:MAG: DUF4160 domain-containing protein [SAR324 cluster bacterium]|nr:DUF4160 domain-containing protein [SAR324 cluster bacterium]